MLTLLRGLLAALGAGCAAIGASIVLLGAEAVGSQAESSFNALTGTTGFSPAWPPTMDSELRFYAALFVAFGLLCLRAARNPQQHGADVPWLMLVFLAGGVGRGAGGVGVGESFAAIIAQVPSGAYVFPWPPVDRGFF